MMKPLVMDRELANAISLDAGNASMRKGGRVAWNEDDYNAAVEAFNRCLPPDWDEGGEA